MIVSQASKTHVAQLLTHLAAAIQSARHVANISALSETERQHAGHIVALCEFEHERFAAIGERMQLDPTQTTLALDAPPRGTVGCDPT